LRKIPHEIKSTEQLLPAVKDTYVVSNPNIGQTLCKLLPSMSGEVHCSFTVGKWWLIGQETEMSIRGLNDVACLFLKDCFRIKIPLAIQVSV